MTATPRSDTTPTEKPIYYCRMCNRQIMWKGFDVIHWPSGAIDCNPADLAPVTA